MFRRTLAELRSPRYVALTAVMVLVAIGCIAAGTWQIARFSLKVRENDALRGNAHDAAVPVQTVLPLVGKPAPSGDAIRLHSVTATGTYLTAAQRFVRLRSVGSRQGYYVLTPLRTASAVLLVVRGFVAQQPNGNPPARVETPPAGTVTVHGRVQSAESTPDEPNGIPATQLQSINPSDQAGRLGTPVYDGYITLEPGSPGTDGVTVIPRPSLSNPAGGAVEPQHFAYIIQWYLFALLALAAPIVMARAEQREKRDDDIGSARSDADSHADAQADAASESAQPRTPDRAAKLADRYGRAAR